MAGGSGTFGAQDLSFPRTPMGNFRSRDFSFPGTFVPWEGKFPGTFVPGPFRSREVSFPGNESSWELSFHGTFVPRTFRSQELSFLRLFYKALPMNADTKTAIATVRICFVVGLVVFVFQKIN